jgi:putative sigma-54 modulation protein
MNVSYKGLKQELAANLQKKLDARLAKLSKLLEKRGQREAHVIVTSERHLHHAEITVQFHDHQLVGAGSDADLFTALSTALDKLEIQARRQTERWREKTRRSKNGVGAREERETAPAPGGEEEAVERRVYHVAHQGNGKPMTLEEALLEMENDRDYLVYWDAEKERMSVLVRRRDGHLDLIEG